VGSQPDAIQFDRDALIFRTLERRNGAVGVLRVAVPLFGIVVLGVLLAEIVVANLATVAGVSGIRFSREAVTIDAPQYAGTMAGGTRYEVNADAASAPLSGRDVIDLTNARLRLFRPDGGEMTATAGAAQFTLSAQTVVVPATMRVTDSRGVQAALSDVAVDWRQQTIVGRAGVEAVFSDGSRLKAKTLVYDAGAQVWDFGEVVLTLPQEEDGE
jgi:hypothetical protein